MEAIQTFFTQNPGFLGLVLSAIGLLLLVGAILNWSWVVSTNRRFSFLRAIFGPRGEMVIASSVIIIAGIVMFVLL